MRVIEARFQEWKPEYKKQKAPLIQDAINDDCIIIDQEHQVVVAAQIKIQPELENVCKQISRSLRHEVRWTIDSARLSGIKSANRVFGTLEPKKIRRRYGCTAATLNTEHPELIQQLEQIATGNFKLFQNIDNHRATEHEKIVKQAIHKDWLIADTPFTSGVINNSAALPYHKDSGNLIGSWSAMLSIRKHTEGGHLHLPEYGLTLGIPDRSVTIFNGQALWHGVTPLIQTRKDAYRYTIVWYAKTQIKQCGCNKDEAKRAAIEASK